MQLETSGLNIMPLNQQQLELYMLDDNSLELSLNLNKKPRIVSERIKQVIVSRIIPAIQISAKDALFYTFWSVIDKQENTLVADLCFKGEPNQNGEIEIGYGTYPQFQKRGVMTEALNGLINWAFSQENVKAILAETDPVNIASNKVLEKNNFTIIKHSENNIWWRLQKSE